MVTVDYECLSTLCIVVYLLDLWLPHFPSILHLAILFHISEIVVEIYITYRKDHINFACCSR
jgi:hypothetical protein